MGLMMTDDRTLTHPEHTKCLNPSPPIIEIPSLLVAVLQHKATYADVVYIWVLWAFTTRWPSYIVSRVHYTPGIFRERLVWSLKSPALVAQLVRKIYRDTPSLFIQINLQFETVLIRFKQWVICYPSACLSAHTRRPLQRPLWKKCTLYGQIPYEL